MRVAGPVGSFIVALICGTPALADFDVSRRWFEQLTVYEREAIQSDLTLLSEYGAIVDGVFGQRTYSALVDFQASLGDVGTGVLTGDQVVTLAARADEIKSELGFEVVRDTAGGITLPVPEAILAEVGGYELGTTYANADGGIVLVTIRSPHSTGSFGDIYADFTDPMPKREVTYSTFNDQRFAIAGIEDGRIFYGYFRNGTYSTVGFVMSWTEQYRDLGGMISVYLASHSALLSETGPPVEQPPPVQPEVETMNASGDQRMGAFVLPENELKVIALDGDITFNAPLDFRRALKERPEASVVMLNSSGGDVAGALLVAHAAAEHGLATYIPAGAGCYSACAFVFFAGRDREAIGELGVHQIWTEQPDLVSAQLALSDIIEALEEFGTDSEVLSIMLRTEPSDMHVFTAAEMEELAINRGASVRLALGGLSADETDERLPAEVVTPEDLNPSPMPGEGDSFSLLGTQSLLLEASDDGTTGAMPFSGSVSWSAGVDDAGLPTLIAKANIPARDLGVELLIRKNSDASLSASHVMEIRFDVSDTFIGRSVAQLPGVLLKNEELVQGTPLTGASAHVVGSSFIFALSASVQESTANTALMTTRRWMDLAIIYATGKRAIITLEKDDLAMLLFSKVFNTWAQADEDLARRQAAEEAMIAEAERLSDEDRKRREAEEEAQRLLLLEQEKNVLLDNRDASDLSKGSFELIAPAEVGSSF